MAIIYLLINATHALINVKHVTYLMIDALVAIVEIYIHIKNVVHVNSNIQVVKHVIQVIAYTVTQQQTS